MNFLLRWNKGGKRWPLWPFLFILITFSYHTNGRSILQEKNDHKKLHPELAAEKAMDAFDIFSENLSHPDKEIRVSTLRILCCYETLNGESSLEVERSGKKMQTEVSPTNVEIQCNNVRSSFPFLLLLFWNIWAKTVIFFLFYKSNLHFF